MVNNPICSMYGIFTYIWVISRANVGKYSIHGAYGKCIPSLIQNWCGWFSTKMGKSLSPDHGGPLYQVWSILTQLHDYFNHLSSSFPYQMQIDVDKLMFGYLSIRIRSSATKIILILQDSTRSYFKEHLRLILNPINPSSPGLSARRRPGCKN